MLDTALKFETPEGGEVDLHPAGFFTRGLALALDELIRWTIIAAFSIVFSLAGDFGSGLFLLTVFLVVWFYGVAFEVFGGGATPGKRAQGLRVVHDDGTPIRLPASLIRNLLLVVDALPVFYVSGMISMMLTRKFCRLGDLVAGTMVVHVNSVSSSEPSDVDGTRPSPFPLSVDEQSALVEFLERSDRLSAARTQELAGILGEWLDAPSALVVREVKKVAAGIRGEV